MIVYGISGLLGGAFVFVWGGRDIKSSSLLRVRSGQRLVVGVQSRGD